MRLARISLIADLLATDSCPVLSTFFSIATRLYIIQITEMAERYTALTEDLHQAKRQAALWRTRHAQAEAENEGLRSELKDAKRALETVQENYYKLTMLNRQLSEDRDSLATGYSTEISSIKEEIAAKHQQILELKEGASPAKIDQNIALRQLKHQLSEDYQTQITSREKKLAEATAQLERLTYEGEIEREKARLKIQGLQDALHQLQQQHESYIFESSARLLQQAQLQARPNQDREALRRAKRDNQQLRRRAELAQNELNEVLEQKNTITRDYGKWMAEYKKAIGDHQTEIEVYKAEIQRLNDAIHQHNSSKDEAALKDKERQVKRLRSHLEEARDDILFREKKIADLQIEKVKLLNDIQTGKAQREKEGNAIEQHLLEDRERLQRELTEVKSVLERTRLQNMELQDKLHDLTRLHSENTHRWETARAQEDARRLIKRQRSEEVIPTADKSIEVSHQKEKQQRKDDAVSVEKAKVKEILAKYIQAKQRNAQLEKKLQKANDKIVQLLQNKIILNSPKANSKKITFPSDNTHSNHHLQLPQQHQTLPQFHQPSAGEKIHGHTMGEMGQRVKETMGYTSPNIHLRREFFSPQEEHHIRIQDEEGNERSYYEKSLKIKHGHRLRQLKCTNHED